MCRVRIARSIVIGLMVLVAAVASPAQTSQADRESDHQALRGLVPVYEQAVNEGKLEALQPYLHPQFTGVMVTGDEVDSFASLQDYWKRIHELIGSTGTYRVKIHVADRSIMSGDMAVAHGTTDERVVTSAGNDFRWNGRWTAAFVKVGDDWKILRAHASMDPVNNPFVSGAVRGWSWFWGFGGGAAGLIVGAAGVAIICRKRKAAN